MSNMPTAFSAENLFAEPIVEAMATEIVPLPVGMYVVVITELPTIVSGVSDKGTWVRLSWKAQVNDPSQEVVELLGRDIIMVNGNTMLDIDPDGKLATGKGRNVGLGRLRHACGCNQAGMPFTLGNLVGRPFNVLIKHKLYEGRMLAEVAEVQPL